MTSCSAPIRSRRFPSTRARGFGGLDYFPYDPELRVLADVEPAAASEPREIAGSGGSTVTFTRFAHAGFDLGGERHSLELYWLEGYGGGIFVPFGDATSGDESYGPGRYVLDSVKGADLGIRTAGSCSTSTSPTTRAARTTIAGRVRSARPLTDSRPDPGRRAHRFNALTVI